MCVCGYVRVYCAGIFTLFFFFFCMVSFMYFFCACASWLLNTHVHKHTLHTYTYTNTHFTYTHTPRHTHTHTHAFTYTHLLTRIYIHTQVLGVVWQLVKKHLLQDINLVEHPELVRLLEDGEEVKSK